MSDEGKIMTETVTVRRDDLDIIVPACLSYFPADVPPDVPLALSRLQIARRVGHGTGPGPEADPRPDGFFGRVELPGYRQHSGWITEETRFGQQVAVVRDWDERVLAEVCIGPMCQVVHLPTPLNRPGAPKAITAWGSAAEGDAGDPDEYLTGDDEDGAF